MLLFFVLMLKIHCWSVDDQRNAVLGVVDSTSCGSSTVFIPEIVRISLKLSTTPIFPMEVPLASQTRNFAGTVLPCLNTLNPSESIGRRISRPGSPLHKPVLWYSTFSVAAM